MSFFSFLTSDFLFKVVSTDLGLKLNDQGLNNEPYKLVD